MARNPRKAAQQARTTNRFFQQESVARCSDNNPRQAEETLEQYERHEQAQANNQQQAGENQTNTAEQGEAQPTRPPKRNTFAELRSIHPQAVMMVRSTLSLPTVRSHLLRVNASLELIISTCTTYVEGNETINVLEYYDLQRSRLFARAINKAWDQMLEADTGDGRPTRNDRVVRREKALRKTWETKEELVKRIWDEIKNSET